MRITSIKIIYISLIALLIILTPFNLVNASSQNWVGVPKSKYGEQLWDKNSFQLNQDGSIRIHSKFIPISSTEITQEILYTMDINCSEKSFKDVALGSNDFNEFKNNDSSWKGANGDELIIGVINQVCACSNLR